MNRRIVKLYRDDDNEIDRLMAEAQERNEYYEDYDFWSGACPECDEFMWDDIIKHYGSEDGYHEIYQWVCRDGCQFSYITECRTDWGTINSKPFTITSYES